MKIICVGRNYAEHARELGNKVPAEPVLFMKADSSLLIRGNPFLIPEFSNNVHYEVELVVKIDRAGKHIAEEFAPKYYSQLATGIDFTARDVQEICRREGLPWEKAKAFDGSCAIGKFVAVSKLRNKSNIAFRLEKNGEVVQQGYSADMMNGINKLIAYISTYFTLKIGDVIFTGTPPGVGQVKAGDKLKSYLEDDVNLSVSIR